MTDDELMAVMVKVDPLTRRIPAGIRAIAQSIEALARAQALEDAAKVCESQRFMALEPLRMHTAEDERRRLMASLKHVAAAIRALPPHG